MAVIHSLAGQHGMMATVDLSFLAPYVPQLITAGATLGAVVLTLLFTRGRDIRRLDLEEQKFKWEIAASDRARFEETKRQAFINYLAESRNYRIKQEKVWLGGPEQRVDRQLHAEVAASAERIAQISSEVIMLDPGLQRVLDERDVLLHTLGSLTFQEDELASWLTRYSLHIMNARSAFSESLGIKAPSTDVHNQPQLDDASPSKARLTRTLPPWTSGGG